MIRILVADDVVTIRGHSTLSPRGSDVVCAGVSAIVQTAILGLRAIAEEHPDQVELEYDDQRVHSGPAEVV